MVKMVYLLVYTGNLLIPGDSITIHGFHGLFHKTSRKEHSREMKEGYSKRIE